MPLSTHTLTPLRDLDDLVAGLPFDLDDAAAVGRTFRRWLRRGGKRASHDLDLWTYCYIRRYFLLKFVRSGALGSPADLEMLIDRAYRRVEDGRRDIREPHRYAHWVVVVCRNTFLNHASRFPEHVAVDRIAEPGAAAAAEDAWHDRALQIGALEAAISRLPTYLRAVAEMRLLRELPYDVIADRTGQPVPSVRAYLHKALVRLRRDGVLLRILGYEPGSGGS